MDMLPNSGAALLEKLAAEDAARKQQQQKRREEVAEKAADGENVPRFLEAFRTSLQQLDDQTQATTQDISTSSGRCLAEHTMKENLEEISSKLNLLEQQLAEAAYFLPSYDLRQASNSIAESKAQIEQAREALAPKRKFTFSRKVNRVKAPLGQPEPDPSTAVDAATQGLSAAQPPCTAAPPAPSVIGCSDGPTLVVLTAEQVQGSDQVVEDLHNCMVFILGVVPALRLRMLTNCQVYTSAVTGATFIDDISASIIMLASYQVRIHTSHHTHFYLRTRSRPIIEHCHGLRFAPYTLPPAHPLRDPTDQQFPDSASTVWSQVEDFNWIKTTQSPNWSLLPGEQHVGPAFPP